jgi:methyl-accepting chemotaxis protein
MKWTVGAKIGMGFGLASTILLVVGAVSYRSTTKLAETSNLVIHTYSVLEHAAGILQSLTDVETGQRGFLLAGQERYLEPYDSGRATVEQHFKEMRSLSNDNPRQQRRLDLLEPLMTQRISTLKEGIELYRSKGMEAARQWVMTGKGKKEMDDIRKLLGEISDEELSLLKTRSAEAEITAQTARWTIFAGSLLGFMVASLAGFSITRNISKPLQILTTTAERMAAGDLSTDVADTPRRDEVGVLSQAFGRMIHSLREMANVARKIADGNLRVEMKPQSEKDVLGNAFATMVENLKQLTQQIAEGINVLSSAANEISASSTQLAAGATETATAISQTTTTVEEVRQTAQLSSQKARSVSESALKMTQISHSGTKSTKESLEGMNQIQLQMNSVADSMVRLSEQTQAIGQIIAAVDDLAAQSNLLAVNASIEAAKAGEQGRGFSVVAQEVRSLAEQSKQATNQVRNILNDIQKATSTAVMATDQSSKVVETGVKQSSETGQSIQLLAGSVNEAAQAATQIAASSQQQLVGVDQVASAMENIKQASVQNVASAQQLEASAHNLNDLGQKLKEMIAAYKI